MVSTFLILASFAPLRLDHPPDLSHVSSFAWLRNFRASRCVLSRCVVLALSLPFPIHSNTFNFYGSAGDALPHSEQALYHEMFSAV